MQALGKAARDAARRLATASSESKIKALREAAAAIRAACRELIAANQQDLAASREQNLSPAMLDRLLLDESRVAAMAHGLEDVAALPDPVGRDPGGLDEAQRARIQRVSVPLGVIGIIYELPAQRHRRCRRAVPQSGNAAILRGGSESSIPRAPSLPACAEGLAPPDCRKPRSSSCRPAIARRSG